MSIQPNTRADVERKIGIAMLYKAQAKTSDARVHATREIERLEKQLAELIKADGPDPDNG